MKLSSPLETTRLPSGEKATLKMRARCPADSCSSSPVRGHQAAVYRVIFAPDGSWLVSASADHTLKIWEAGPGFSR